MCETKNPSDRFRPSRAVGEIKRSFEAGADLEQFETWQEKVIFAIIASRRRGLTQDEFRCFATLIQENAAELLTTWGDRWINSVVDTVLECQWATREDRICAGLASYMRLAEKLHHPKKNAAAGFEIGVRGIADAHRNWMERASRVTGEFWSGMIASRLLSYVEKKETTLWGNFDRLSDRNVTEDILNCWQADLYCIDRRKDFPGLLDNLGLVGGYGIELGVATGKFSARLVGRGLWKRFYSVDRWGGDRGHDDRQYQKACDRLRPFPNSRILRSDFREALEQFPDEHFDFAYLDGYAHQGQGSDEHFREWYAKVKPGGIFAGHDYAPKWPRNVAAVNRFTKQFGLEIHLTVQDRFPSWYVQKP